MRETGEVWPFDHVVVVVVVVPVVGGLVDPVVVVTAAHCPLTQEAEQRLDEIPPFDQLHNQIYDPLDIVTAVGTPDTHRLVGETVCGVG